MCLIGYALSGEPTLKAFYERLASFAEPFMALFGRNHLPHRATLSRFLATLDQPTVEALRAWLKVVSSQTVWIESSTRTEPSPVPPPAEEVLTSVERPHWRLSWDQRLARNSRPSNAPRLSVTLHGLPATFAHSFGFALFATA
jgi:hypothetical protein